MAERKTSAGRQRIEMKKIESEEARHVCFSKRRMGLFKKASDLSTLTGAQIAIIVFSQAGKAFSFGSPAVDVVIDRFLSGGRPPSGPTLQSGYAKLVRELNARCMEVTSCMVVTSCMEAAKRRKLALEGRLKALAAESHLCAWASNVDSLELSELEQLSVAMEALKARSDAWLGELLRAEAPCSSNLVLAVNPRGMFDPYNAEAMMACSAGHMGYGTGFF